MSGSPEPRSLRSVGTAKLISVSRAELIKIDSYLLLGSEFDLRTSQQLVAPHSLSIGYIPCEIGSNSNTDQKSDLNKPTSSTAFCCFELVNVEYNKFKFRTTGIEHSSNESSHSCVEQTIGFAGTSGGAGCGRDWRTMMGGKERNV